MQIDYPNGSYELWADKPKMLLCIGAKNPFGKNWTMNIKNGIHNQATGNPDAAGIWRRKRKWYLKYEPGIGYNWV